MSQNEPSKREDGKLAWKKWRRDKKDAKTTKSETIACSTARLFIPSSVSDFLFIFNSYIQFINDPSLRSLKIQLVDYNNYGKIQQDKYQFSRNQSRVSFIVSSKGLGEKPSSWKAFW